jgi:trk system potassium uptake protein TrkA
VDERVFVLTLPQNLAELVALSGQPRHLVRRVLIVGCGNTGLAVARKLERHGLCPTILEKAKDRAEEVASILSSSLVVHSDASNPEVLRARIEEGDVDAVVVLLKEPELSVLIGIFAKSLGARKVVARCDEAGYVPLAHKLGIDAIVSPKRAMINAILRYVRRGTVESTLLLGDHEAEILEFKVPERPEVRDLIEKPLKDLHFPRGSLVGAVVRNGEASIPSGNTILRPGDSLFVACGQELLSRVERLLS